MQPPELDYAQTVGVYLSPAGSADGSRPLTEFSIPSLAVSWAAVAVKVQSNLLTLYINCQDRTDKNCFIFLKSIGIRI